MIYIELDVYDYDLSKRHRIIKHKCRDFEQAKHLVKRLQTLKGIYIGGGRTGGWLRRHYRIDGFIDNINGIYEQTTRRLL